MDPNSYQFMALANQPAGCYVPSTGGMTTMYHHQAGDLHTPLAYSLATPLSMNNPLSSTLPVDPTSDMNIDYHNMHDQFMPHQFHSMDSFSEQAGFTGSFIPRDSGYDSMDRPEESSMDQMTVPNAQPINLMMPNVGYAEEMDLSAETHGEK